MMKKQKVRRYVTIEEVVEMVGVSRRTVYSWMANGLLGVIYRTPTGSPRLDRAAVLNTTNRQRNRYRENLTDGTSKSKSTTRQS